MTAIVKTRHRRDDWTDGFCGAGGSSSGIKLIKGTEVRVAANHWSLAVETHNTNHPDTMHLVENISQTDPRRFPRTRFAWWSPSCTNHSQAKGIARRHQLDLFEEYVPDEAADRSRATMWDVPRFAEFHGYDYIIVENVVEAAKWVMYPAWLQAMSLLGYEHHEVFLNAMFAHQGGAPAPQSRDRIYIVFWRKGLPMPDLDKWTRPTAWCPGCGEFVRAVQAWKNPAKRWGRYRSQYVYRCPNVTCRNQTVEPGYLPAAVAIDWNLPATRIGDREIEGLKPLAAKTLARIQAGLLKYGTPVHLEVAGNAYDSLDPKHRQHGDPDGYVRAWPVADPFKTLHTTLSKGIAWTQAMVVPVEGREGKQAQSVAEPMRTQTARNESGVLIPPFMVELRGGGSNHRPITEPLATVTASGNHHGLLVPYYSRSASASSTADPMGTVTTTDRYALVMRNNTGGAEMLTPVGEPLRTLTTGAHQSIVEWSQPRVPDVDDCLFRMIEPHEAQAGMAFDAEYVVLGNKRERVKQVGNAVCPPCARDLGAAVMEAAHGEPVEFVTAA